MLRLVTPLLLATFVAAQSGYSTDTDVSIHLELGAKLLEVKAAIEADPPDWSGGIAAYQEDVDAGTDELSLAIIGEKYGADVPTNTEFAKFKAFHGDNAGYANDFVYQALADTFHPRLPLSSSGGGVAMLDLPEVADATEDQRGGPEGIAIKSRQEMTMKGIALQSLMMGMINHLYKAHASCVAGEATPEAYVDQAWVLFYGGGKGPIALGDKRCIQFGTCTESTANVFPSDHAGDSAVNTKILDAFLATQTAAKTTDCPTMLTQIEDIIIPQAFVPVMQGLFREAWEVDEELREEHFGADGFVEQIEGWAFLMAVLPRIDDCDSAVTTTVLENTQIRMSVDDPRMVKDGYQTVIAAVEGTFSCLDVQCSELNTMYGSADRVAIGTPDDDACPHWTPCDNGQTLPREPAEVLDACNAPVPEPEPEPEPEAEPEKASGSNRVYLAMGVLVATLAVVVG